MGKECHKGYNSQYGKGDEGETKHFGVGSIVIVRCLVMRGGLKMLAFLFRHKCFSFLCLLLLKDFPTFDTDKLCQEVEGGCTWSDRF